MDSLPANVMARDAQIYSIPTTAQRAQDVSLPDDAAERKRVLNILAQRRYRKSNLQRSRI